MSYTIVLDSRSSTYDRIVNGANDPGLFRRISGVGAVIEELDNWPTSTLFVHALDCDETKLLDGLKRLPSSKLPGNIVVYGMYENLSAKLVYMLSAVLGREVQISSINSDL